MTTTLTPTCALCGLRFENRPLLDLHLCEDHPQRRPTADPGRATPAPAAFAPPPRTSPENSSPQAPATDAGPGQPRGGRSLRGLRRIGRAFRHANAQLMLASELLVRPALRPRSTRPAAPPAGPDAHQPASKGRIGRAA
jgi:hypothetical protein